MLSLSINLSDLDGEVEEIAGGFRFGASALDPFRSRHIQADSHGTQDKLAFWVGEDSPPFLGWNDIIANFRAVRCHHGCDGAIISIARGSKDASVDLARTSAGASPMYIAVGDGRLVATWRFEEAVNALPSVIPDDDACRLYLQHGATLSRAQIFQGLHMLWPGESLSFKDGKLRFFPGEEPAVCLESMISDGARATDCFLELIGQSLSRVIRKSESVLVELSGGYDSSCVGIAARHFERRISSYGVIHDGAMGTQQRNRRGELNRLLQFDDYEHPASMSGPLSGLDDPECRVTPNDDNHRLSSAGAIDNHPSGTFDLAVTGVGGDELTMEHTFQREPWELAGSVCPSSLVVATARADLFMRRGIWSTNPLMCPHVIDFCRSLPLVIRRDRTLNVLTLARAGLSDGFIFPRYVEHFGTSMRLEASLFDYDAVMKESVLADYGIVDFSGLLRRARLAVASDFPFQLIGALFNLVKLEKVLRRYIG